MEIGDGMDNNSSNSSPSQALVVAPTELASEIQCDNLLKRSLIEEQSSPSLFSDTRLQHSEVYENALSSSHKNISAACKTTSDVDLLDSSLLHQFSCMGTRDHDDLIEQFNSLMNNQMSKDAARFFLEMSNWNLQTAVGCFLDFYNGQNLPSMKILHQSQPHSRQVMWRIQNDGTDSWPKGCYLISNNQLQRIEMPSIKPGESCEVVASICPTDAIAWRLCAPHGEYFGDHLCLTTLNSFNAPSEELNQRLAQMAVSEREQSNAASNNYPQINIIISEQMK